MVEDVEELGAEIDALGFRDLESLQQCKVGVADVRTTTDGSRCISDPTKKAGINGRVLGKCTGIEGVVTQTAEASRLRLCCLERLQLVRLTWQLEVEAVHKLIVGRGDDANGE